MEPDGSHQPVGLEYAAPPGGPGTYPRAARVALYLSGFISPIALLIAVEALLYPRFRLELSDGPVRLGVSLILLTAAVVLPLVLMGLRIARDYAAGWLGGMIAMIILGPIAIIVLGWLNL